MVFIKKVLLLCCLPLLAFIVMPINCNKLRSEVDRSFKRYARQVNANNDQQIGVNDTHSLGNFGASIESDVGDAQQEGGKSVDKTNDDPVILSGRNGEGRRGRQLNIYSTGQGKVEIPWVNLKFEYQ